ncbi:DUF3237 domain-containing protein [Pseudooceanicola sp. MF1-13]|uniref:DUF3237 domain-containing protein n=1 Tax=Pseudooceanicola sp. MF1-13 TaxID=3379095 RepID=UPI0038915666
MPELSTRPLMKVFLDVGPATDLRGGNTEGRLIYHVTGGSFEGERLRGVVKPVSGDWVSVKDGFARIDVRLLLETDDGTAIYMAYEGVHTLSAEHREILAQGQMPDPGSYYFRVAPFFEAADPKYQWLNKIVTVGVGTRTQQGVEYDVYEVL